MKPLLRRYCVLLALLIHWVPLSQAQVAPQRVQQIAVRHVGPAAASDELIRANIRVKVGDSLVKTSVDDDVRNLYNTGYFYNIRVAEERVDGGVRLIYVPRGPCLEPAHALARGRRRQGSRRRSTSLPGRTSPLHRHPLPAL